MSCALGSRRDVSRLSPSDGRRRPAGASPGLLGSSRGAVPAWGCFPLSGSPGVMGSRGAEGQADRAPCTRTPCRVPPHAHSPPGTPRPCLPSGTEQHRAGGERGGSTGLGWRGHSSPAAGKAEPPRGSRTFTHSLLPALGSTSGRALALQTRFWPLGRPVLAQQGAGTQQSPSGEGQPASRATVS